ncbi:hypothetical protein Nepgr_005814 [Nepenthes gracilis]|uniref:Uncharacterized protein n=1 Tax=Nepenthes gracilis TaxID=150966 RepID=A0AAD3XGT4_NEPGR|nr:hypothetical protein Nepgr_005814 [Nepenthes gracilis]
MSARVHSSLSSVDRYGRGHGCLLSGCAPRSSLFPAHRFASAPIIKWHFSGDPDARLLTKRTKSHTFHILAKANFSSGKKEVIMVDPLEAKRIAAKEMEEIQAKEKLKRKCRAEAINGAWAMIGLMAGLVIEGHTGKSILSQLAGYLDAIIGFFSR